MYSESNVGARIRYLRNMRGWSQEMLALQAEINPAFLGHLERGLKCPTVKTLEKIAHALDISMAELFEETTAISDEHTALLSQLTHSLQMLPIEKLRIIHRIVFDILFLSK